MSRWPSSSTQCSLGAAPAVVSAPWSPARPRYLDARSVSLRAMAPVVRVLQRFAFLRGGMAASAVGNGIVASACVAGTVGGDAADLLAHGDPVEQVRWHRRIADVAPDVRRQRPGVGVLSEAGLCIGEDRCLRIAARARSTLSTPKATPLPARFSWVEWNSAVQSAIAR